MLGWLAGLPQCAEALAQGLCERELLDAAGERHRPDVLLLGKTATEVLDFKTGQPKPDHLAQVRRYLALARAMPGRGRLPARGWLVYFDGRVCQAVEEAP